MRTPGVSPIPAHADAHPCNLPASIAVPEASQLVASAVSSFDGLLACLAAAQARPPSLRTHTRKRTRGPHYRWATSASHARAMSIAPPLWAPRCTLQAATTVGNGICGVPAVEGRAPQAASMVGSVRDGSQGLRESTVVCPPLASPALTCSAHPFCTSAFVCVSRSRLCGCARWLVHAAGRYLNDMWCFDTLTLTWQQLVPVPATRLTKQAAPTSGSAHSASR